MLFAPEMSPIFDWVQNDTTKIYAELCQKTPSPWGTNRPLSLPNLYSTRASGTNVGSWRFTQRCQVVITTKTTTLPLTFMILSEINKTYRGGGGNAGDQTPTAYIRSFAIECDPMDIRRRSVFEFEQSGEEIDAGCYLSRYYFTVYASGILFKRVTYI